MNYELRSYIVISRLKNEIDAKSNKLVKEYGLSLPQFAVMEALYHKKDMSVGQVREKILSSSGTMPVIIRNLKKKSYLISYKDKEDKRREILSLTNEGKKLIEEIFPKNKKIIEKSFENLSRDEIKDFVKILKNLEV